MSACPSCREAIHPEDEICMSCGEPLAAGRYAAQPASTSPPVAAPPAVTVPVVPKRKLRVDDPDPVRCPGCGSPSRAARCPGCGAVLRRDD